MSPISGFTQAAQSLQNVWNRVGQKADVLVEQVGTGDAALVQTVVELKALKLQAAAAGMIFKTLNDMASELLTSPRK